MIAFPVDRLPRLVLQFRGGGNPLKLQVEFPQNGTVVLKGPTEGFTRALRLR